MANASSGYRFIMISAGILGAVAIWHDKKALSADNQTGSKITLWCEVIDLQALQPGKSGDVRRSSRTTFEVVKDKPVRTSIQLGGGPTANAPLVDRSEFEFAPRGDVFPMDADVSYQFVSSRRQGFQIKDRVRISGEASCVAVRSKDGDRILIVEMLPAGK